MSLRFDWYPNYQHEVIISKSNLIVDKLITKGMAQRTIQFLMAELFFLHPRSSDFFCGRAGAAGEG